ncbi:hypothetical protein, partial [Endozoicomonas sp.]|uniref:hypothetical protein n=1 Tax=Endozoicomonas sp. TaxID=1892382 RepID=UPI00383B9D57
TEAAFVVKARFSSLKSRRRKKLSNSLTLPLGPCQWRRILPHPVDLSTGCFSTNLQIVLPGQRSTFVSLSRHVSWKSGAFYAGQNKSQQPVLFSIFTKKAAEKRPF